MRSAAAVAGVIVGMALAAVLINKVRLHYGVAAAGVAFVPAALLFSLGWLLVLILLPRRTEDPGTVLPGAVVMGVVLAILQAVSELYLPDRFHRASQLYGAIGTTLVILAWFFILGRVCVLSIELNAAIFRTYGSISRLVFSLPVVRLVPRHSPKLRRYFDLDGPDDRDG